MARTRQVAAFWALVWGGSALAQPGPDGIDWVTITNPGNAAYNGPDPFGYVSGRGSVGYEYRMSRTEVTTAQWMEFYNTFTTRAEPVPWLRAPVDWGAVPDPTYPGPGVRYRLSTLPGAAMIPAYGVTWRTCALYCNWLHNGKSGDPALLMSGAYDVSTFHDNPDGTFTDQVTRSPGARYFIPSLDEWLKAAHWSPTNPNNAGWYTYSNGSDIPLTYGPPPSFGGDGTGQANAGFRLPNFREYDIPLGSYADTSIWGLRDIAGCGGEWLEEIQRGTAGMWRYYDGSYAGGPGIDRVYSASGSQTPGSLGGDFDLRLASSVASPGACGILGASLCVLQGGFARRRRAHDASAHDPAVC